MVVTSEALKLLVVIFVSCTKQGVALTGRNTTGPPSRAAPNVLRCICADVTDDDRRQTTDNDDIRQRLLLVWPLHYV